MDGGEKNKPPLASEAYNGKTHVLLIENDQLEAARISELLTREKSHPFEVNVAQKLPTGLDGLAKGRVDVVLLDLEWPDRSALDMFKAVQEAAPNVPIIVLSGKDEETALEAVRDGAQDHVDKKTLEGKLLTKVIRYAIQRKLSEQALYESAERIRTLVANIPGAIYRARYLPRGELKFEYVSDAIKEISGHPAADFIHHRVRSYNSVIFPDDIIAVENAIKKSAQEKTSFSMDYRIRHADGSVKWVHDQGRVVLGNHGEALWVDGCIFDITERMRVEERLNYLANRDGLTGLPNRLQFLDRIKHAMSVARSEGDVRVALLFLGLDHFKRVNNMLGHAVGDQLLKAAANRMTKLMQAGETMTRIGGDEFAVLLPTISKVEDAVGFAEKIFAELKPPFQIEEHELYMSCSIGMGFFPKDTEDPDRLLKGAATAMLAAKAKGKNNFQIFSPAMEEKSSAFAQRLVMENSLRRAIDRNEFQLHFQPQLDLRSGEITGAEALVRWQDPTLGLVSPADFIPLAEETGLIVPLGEWVLRVACTQNKAWRNSGLPALRMAVNLSARQFQQTNLTNQIARVLAQTGMDSQELELELTEGVIMHDVTKAIHTLRALHAMGLKVSIDDFGTGYSSLSYLKRFPINTLKIDRSFVKDIISDPDAAAIVKAIISMAHSLKLEVVAEGVETESQLSFLRSQGCDKMQGFLFSSAVPAETFTRFLLTGRRLDLWKKNGGGS